VRNHVIILPVDDLSNAIKPTYLPGEKINVKIIKEGKEKEQGIAYLNDGTMIVVDGARKMTNKRIDVIVTNVLQTDAGRMIFTRYEQHGGHEGHNGHQNNNNNRDNRRDFRK